MNKITANQSFQENIDFLASSKCWETLKKLNYSLNSNLFDNDELNQQLRKVETVMNDFLCDDSWMGHSAKYQLQSGGKRFRVVLALLASKIFNLDTKSSINVAVCCEFIHNASLIHDDLQDRDLIRRGMPTIWSRFGEHTAINLGDYFISGSFEALVKANAEPKLKCLAIEELSKTIKQTVKGQSMEILGRSDFYLKMQDYESTARAKTGALLCLPVKLVMLLKGLNKCGPTFLNPLLETGLAYQIQDDLSDFLGIKDRGLPGRDLKEGKMNVLVMHYINSATPGEKYLLQQFLKKRYDTISENEILHWILQIRRKGGIEKSIKHLKFVAEKSLKLSKKTDEKLFKIVKFVISSTLDRISEKVNN